MINRFLMYSTIAYSKMAANTKTMHPNCQTSVAFKLIDLGAASLKNRWKIDKKSILDTKVSCLFTFCYEFQLFVYIFILPFCLHFVFNCSCLFTFWSEFEAVCLQFYIDLCWLSRPKIGFCHSVQDITEYYITFLIITNVTHWK